MSQSALAPFDSPRQTHVAWLVVALLWPVALMNYLDRQMIASMKLSVTTDIHISLDQDWGRMLAQFKWVYAGLSPVAGYLADRFSRRWTICSSLLAWSAITWATGRVETYEGLLWTRTLMGISEAFYMPAALALIADYHSAATRSRAIGVHQTAIYAGLILGGYSGYIADNAELGWRMAFDMTGIAGILYVVPLTLLLRDRRPAAGVTPALAPSWPAAGAVFRELATNRSFILLVLCFTLPALAGWIVKDWMPEILRDRFALGQGLAGKSATLYVNIASLGGVFFGGWLADWLMRRTVRGRIFVSAAGMSLLIPSLFGVGDSGTLGVAILFLVLFGVGWGFFDCNNMPILSQIVRPHLRATGYGIMNLVSISCGGFADWGFGALRDRQVPLNVIFGLFAAAAMFSVILMLLIKPKPEPAERSHP